MVISRYAYAKLIIIIPYSQNSINNFCMRILICNRAIHSPRNIDKQFKLLPTNMSPDE